MKGNRRTLEQAAEIMRSNPVYTPGTEDTIDEEMEEEQPARPKKKTEKTTERKRTAAKKVEVKVEKKAQVKVEKKVEVKKTTERRRSKKIEATTEKKTTKKTEKKKVVLEEVEEEDEDEDDDEEDDDEQAADLSMNTHRDHEEYKKFVKDEKKKSIMDRKFDRGELAASKEMLQAVYKKVRKEYDKLVQEELETDYLETLRRQAGRPRAARAVQNLYRPEFKIEPPAESEFLRTTSLKSVNARRPTQTVPLVKIETREALPPMPYWVLAESNLLCPDNLRLSHVPYLNEEQDDQNLLENMIGLFDEGIHGYKENWDYMNDWILFEMLKLVFDKYPQHKKIICYAFYELFPNKYSYRKLPDVFERLNVRFQKKSTIENLDFGSIKELNFAAENKTETTLDDEERELQNIYASESLNCRQCSTYDCQAHGFMPLLQHSFIPGTWFPKDIPVPNKEEEEKEEGCHENCYKNMTLEDVADRLEIEPEDIKDHIINGYYSKQVIQRMTDAEEFGILLLYVSSPKQVKGQVPPPQSLCEFAKENTLEWNYNGCMKLYDLLLKYIEFPTQARLMVDKERVFQPTSAQIKRFRNAAWRKGGGQIENMKKMEPCNHEGPCGGESCSCAANGVCSKYCNCDETCRLKFPGCRCTPGQCKTNSCQCYYGQWECDPETCKTCGCDSFEPSDITCKNSSIGKGYQKAIRVEPSKIAGWGAFIQERAEKGELISEYCGELITQAEAERRGQVCDKMKMSYIFSLNDDWVVDAQRVGNNIRFANHSDTQDNCSAKVLIVNAQHRIGIYAKQDLEPGTELLFNYQYNKQHKKEFVNHDKYGKKTESKKRAKTPTEDMRSRSATPVEEDSDGPSTSTAPVKKGRKSKAT